MRRAQAAVSELEAGDVLISWIRADRNGTLTTPFDLTEVELEQAPRGRVLILGRRGTRDMTWTFNPAWWELVTRPEMPGDVLRLYRDAEQLSAAGKATVAQPAFSAAAGKTLAASRQGVSSWILSKSAEALALAGAWVACDDAYRTAIERASRRNASQQSALWRAWAATLVSRRNWAEAQRAFDEALRLTANQPDIALTSAATLRAVGAMARRRGDLTNAERRYTEALEIRRREAPDSIDLARSLNDLGALAQDRNDVDQCRRYYTEALELASKIAPGSLDVARNFMGLGYVELYLDLDKARELYLKALAIQEDVAPDSLHVAQSLISLGMASSNQGDLAGAEAYYLHALTIERQLAPRSRDAALCLFNLAIAVRERGDLVRAEDFNREALSIFEESSPGSLDVARVLTNFGLIAKDRGDLDASETYHRRSLELKQRLVPDTLSVAVSLSNLGNILRERGDLPGAARNFRDALSIYERLVPGSASYGGALFGLGDVAVSAGHLDEAEAYYRRALAIDEVLAPNTTNHAQSLEAVGRVVLARGSPGEAEPFFKRSLDALEMQTARLGGTEELRATFRARHGGFYREHIEALLAQDKAAEAFHTLERSRARSFLAMLAERDATFNSQMPAEVKEALKRNASAYDRLQTQLANLNASRDADRIRNLQSQMQRVAAERSQWIEQLRLASPDLAAIRYPKPLNLTQSAGTLDPGTIALSYSVGPQDSVLFVLTRNGTQPRLEWFPLPASSLNLREMVDRFRATIQRRGQRADTDFQLQSRALYNLLIKPAEKFIAGADRVVIVPDGPLHALPFSALVAHDGRFLIESKPLHSILSLTTYAELAKGRAGTHTYAYDVAAFGDPRYPGERSAGAQRSRALQAAVERGFTFTPLLSSRYEVEAIAQLFPGRTKTFLGPAATEHAARSLSVEARYLHFATHAFVDEKFPLDSALVLSIPERLREGQENGLLQAWEIFQSVRWKCDLVVLSACRTALGSELTGEGLIGLTRAIQYAGARSVVASLWNVDDRRSAQFMERFYRYLKSGQSKDQALRHAQLDFLKSHLTAHPANWAAFILNGDWR